MNISSAFIISVLILFMSQAQAGCPAMMIQQASTEILECHYSINKPVGVVMEVNINYSNEPHMGEHSAKKMKTRIYQASSDKAACKKFEKGKTFCINLSQWCRMAGDPPHAARFTVNSVIDGKCQTRSSIPE